jgi:outer membrane protein
MKKSILVMVLLFACLTSANAADLLEVYQQALCSDPIYQQAVSQRLATKQGVPISLASLLPSLVMTVNPSITRSGFSGANTHGIGFTARNNTVQNYELALTATQTVFDYSQLANLKGSVATSKSADATLNAALQDLMIRVANAYFAILHDEDNLRYSYASKQAYAEQLSQTTHQYKAGLKTITDVYTAQASYDNATANVIAMQTALENDRENLRVITGKYYPKLSSLSEAFPLVSPRPRQIDEWVRRSQMQNWSIRSAQYAVDSARQTVRQQFGGHLPTVNIQGQWDRIYTKNINGYANIAQRNGTSTEADKQIMININVPILSGGAVVAETNQAIYQFQIAQQQLEQITRATINTTRQSYMGVIAGISQISADKQAVKSSLSSLHGMKANYRAGTETLVDVLNEQQRLFQTETQYANDKYHFVNNVLALKQAAGTLSFNDLRAMNAWLS